MLRLSAGLKGRFGQCLTVSCWQRLGQVHGRANRIGSGLGRWRVGYEFAMSGRAKEAELALEAAMYPNVSSGGME